MRFGAFFFLGGVGAARLSHFQNHTVRHGFSLNGAVRCGFSFSRIIRCGAVRFGAVFHSTVVSYDAVERAP